jgi:hypothetical protein
MLAIIPDLYLIWKLQGQMVSDIAAVHGKTAFLTSEGMMYCLFKHGAAQLLRELVVTSGRRSLVRRASRGSLGRIGLGVSERLASRAFYRWIPLAGAAAAGAFAYYDTAKIARTAMDLFSSELSIEDAPIDRCA